MDSIGAPGSPMLAATSSLPMQSPSSTTPVEAESSRMGLKRQFIQTSMADEANSTTNEHVSDRQHHETATWYGHKRRQAASPQPYRMRHSNAMKAPRHLQCMSPTSVSATTTTPVSPTTATARPVLTRPIARPLKRRCTEPIVPCHRRSNSLPDSFRYAINFKYPTDPHLTRAHIVELHANALSVDPISIHVPGLKPPVSKTSLAELDSREILQNRQLRIDIVFDEKLCFRPNLDGERCASIVSRCRAKVLMLYTAESASVSRTTVSGIPSLEKYRPDAVAHALASTTSSRLASAPFSDRACHLA